MVQPKEVEPLQSPMQGKDCLQVRLRGGLDEQCVGGLLLPLGLLTLVPLHCRPSFLLPVNLNPTCPPGPNSNLTYFINSSLMTSVGGSLSFAKTFL